MKQYLVRVRRTVLSVILALSSTGALLAGPAVGSAAAASCRQYSTGTHVAQSGYMATYTERVPYGSPCRDINIVGGRSVYGDRCGYYRVRFYPSSGGSYANSWQYKCSSVTAPSLQVIASNVVEGTRYRIEVSGNTFYQFSVFD